MLENNRIEVYVDNEWGIMRELKKDEFKDLKISKFVLEEIPTHSFLHKKHKALAPKLSAILKEMKKEGLIQKLELLAEKRTNEIIAGKRYSVLDR